VGSTHPAAQPKPPTGRGPRPALHPHSAINYERFNSNNVSIRCWSWNYRGCWHQTCPPVDTHCSVWIWHTSRTILPARAGMVTIPRCCLINACWQWAIYAPAARLGSGSRLSGSLSGI